VAPVLAGDARMHRGVEDREQPGRLEGRSGGGFHTTQISVQVQLEASASQWHNVALANPPANFPPSGGTVMFGTATLVRALRIMPTA
jgi:hypothetical protein